MNSRVMVSTAKAAARVRKSSRAIGSYDQSGANGDGHDEDEGPVTPAHTKMTGANGHGIGPDTEEGGVAEGRVAGVAAQHVPGTRQAGVHHREHEQVDLPVLAGDQREHGQDRDEGQRLDGARWPDPGF